MKSISVKFKEEELKEIERLSNKCHKGTATYIHDVVALLLNDPIRESLEECERQLSNILAIADKMNSGYYMSKQEDMAIYAFMKQYDAENDPHKLAMVLNKLAYRVWMIQDWLNEDKGLRDEKKIKGMDTQTWEDLEEEVFPNVNVSDYI